MEHLWSPWRSAYLQQADARNAEGCFLCGCAADADRTEQNLVVAQFAHTIVVMNRYPYNAGHLLVAPRAHLGDLATMDAAIAHEIMTVTQACVQVLQGVLQPHGCNIGANLGVDAGAGVPDHVHMHVVPRWRGDTNFMPVLADIKMVGARLEELWSQLCTAFDELQGRS